MLKTCLRTLKIDSLGLIVPTGYEHLTAEQKEKLCNGMGPQGWGWLIPDSFHGVDVSEAGNRHDYSYSIGGSWWDKVIADLSFLYNMLRLIWNHEPQFQLRRPTLAVSYFLAVFFGGSKYFRGGGD